MLPTAALPTSLASPLPVDLASQVAAQTAEVGQFDALLAGTIGLNSQLGPQQQAIAKTVEPSANPAADLPESGKDLPEPEAIGIAGPDTNIAGSISVLAIGATPSTVADAAPPPAALAAAALVIFPATVVPTDSATPLRARPEPALRRMAPPLPPSSQRIVPSMNEMKAAVDLPVPTAEPAQASGPFPAPKDTRTSATVALPVPVLARAPAPALAHLPTSRPGSTLAAIAQTIVVPPVPVTTPPEAARQDAAAVLVTVLPSLAASTPDKPVTIPIEPAAALGPGQPELPGVSPTFVVQANHATPFSAATVVPGPQDFTHLIDRLVAARESAQPQAATLALAHAEFGPVELRFSQDGNGLSVTMASRDPDFARAVQAAVPPVGASSDSSGAQQRHSAPGSFQSGLSGGGQPQGQSGNHGQAHAMPKDHRIAANLARAEPEKPDDQHGIFA